MSRHLWSTIKGWPLVFLVLLVAVNGLWLGLPHWQRLVRTRKADAVLATLRATPPSESARQMELAGEILELVPGHPGAMQVLSAALERQGDARALDVSAALCSAGTATDEDRVMLCRQALLWGKPAAAAAVVSAETSHPERDRPPALSEGVARCLAAQGRWSEALSWLEGQWKRREAPSLRLAWADLRAAVPSISPTSRADAAREMASVLRPLLGDAPSPDGSVAGLMLARVLLATETTDPALLAERDRVRQRLEATANAPTAGTVVDVECRLAAAALVLKATPGEKAAVLSGLTQWFSPKDDRAQLAFGHWLRGQGWFDEAVAWVDRRQAAAQNGEWFLLRLDSLVGSGKWEAARGALEGADLPVSKLAAAVFRHRVAVASKEPEPEVLRCAESVRGAFAAAKVEELLWAAQNLESAGSDALALGAYDGVTQKAPTQAPAWLGVLRTLPRTDATLVRREHALRQASALIPNVAEIENEKAYLNLLANRDVSSAAATADALTAERPEAAAFLVTQALARLRAHKPAEALASLDAAKVDWSTVPAGARAIRVAVLAANGRQTEADDLRKSVAPSECLAAERTLAGLH